MFEGCDGKIVVTGFAGLIGSAVIWELNRNSKSNIWGVDDFSRGSTKSRNVKLLAFEKKFGISEFREMIRNDHSDLQEVSAIIHLGACSSTTETNLDYLENNNFLYTRELCEWSINKNVRFIYASSASTYGDGALGMDDRDIEIEKFNPLNPYAASKHKFDLLAKRKGWLATIVGLKFFNVFGPNEEHKGDMRSVVSKAYEQICNEGCISLFKSHHPDYENGKQMRDFLYVKDAARMTFWFVNQSNAAGLYNLGSGKARTWFDLATSIFLALGKSPNIKFVDMPINLRGKYQYFTEASIQKLRSAGYNETITSLEDAVKDYVIQYLIPDKRLEA